MTTWYIHNIFYSKPDAIPLILIFFRVTCAAQMKEVHLGHETTSAIVLHWLLLSISLGKLLTFTVQSTGSCKLDSYHSHSHWNRREWYGWLVKEVLSLPTGQGDLGIECPIQCCEETGSVTHHSLHSCSLWGKEKDAVTLDPTSCFLWSMCSFTHLNSDSRWCI